MCKIKFKTFQIQVFPSHTMGFRNKKSLVLLFAHFKNTVFTIISIIFRKISLHCKRAYADEPGLSKIQKYESTEKTET